MTKKKRITKQLLTMVLTASLVATSVISVPHLSFAEESEVVTEDTSEDAVASEETSDAETEEKSEEAEVTKETDGEENGDSNDSSEEVSSEESSEDSQEPGDSGESENPEAEDEADGVDNADDANVTDAEAGTTETEEIQPEEVLEAEEIKAEEETEAEVDEEEEEEEEETLEESSYPAKSFGPKSISSVTVEASVDEGVFPEGTEMILSSVSSDVTEQIKEAANDLTEDSEEVVDVIAVDISFVCDGAEIQPEDGSVRVNMRTERTVEGDSHKVVHFDDGDAEIVANASANSASLNADSFSVYAIVGTEYQDEEVQQKARYFYEFYIEDTLVDRQIIKNGDTLVEPSVPESGENRKFTGWRINGEAEDMTFCNAIAVEGEEDKYIRVEAHFEEFFKVTFYTSDEKSSILQNVIVKDGETVSTKDQILPGDDLHMFDGWYNAADSSKEAVEEVVVKGADVELVPIFKEGIWVRFNSNGGSYVKPVFIMPNTTVEEPTEPTLPGYEFAGWYTSKECEEDDEFDFSEAISETITLYAGWDAQVVKYQVAVWTENRNDDSYSLYQILEKTAPTETILTSNMFSNIVPIDVVAPCFDIDAEKTDAEVCTVKGDGTTVYNVYFSRHRFTVAFWKDGRKLFTIPDVKYNENFINNYNEAMETNEVSIVEGSGGWTRTWRDSYVNTDGRRLANNTISVSVDDGTAAEYNQKLLPHKNNAGELAFTRRDVKYYQYDKYYYYEYLDDETTPDRAEIVEFEGKKYYFARLDKHFNIDQVWSYNYSKDRPFVLKCANYRESGENIFLDDRGGFWYIRTTTDPVNVYFSRNSYTLRFDDSSLKAYTLKYEEKLESCEPEGYVVDETSKEVDGKTYIFKGWTTADGEIVDFSTARMPGENLMLYAKWEPVSFKVTFDYDNGTPKDFVTVISGDMVEQPVNPEKDGYTFVGWKTSTGEMFSFDSKIVEDTDLVAIWMSEKAYTVKYDAGEFGSFSKKDLNHYANGARAIIVGIPTVTDESKKFIGWQIGDNSKLYKAGAFVINEDDADDAGVITLVAQYEDKPELTAITYDPNGHKGKAVTFKDVSTNNDIVKAKNPSDADVNFAANPGYKFEKWNTKADGSGESFYPGETIALNNTDGKAAILYAQWVVKDDVLKYNANGGTGTMEDTKGKTFEIVKVLVNEFSRKGYTFTGWNTKADGTGDAYAEGAGYKLTPEDDILYAQWEANADKLSYDANGGIGTMEDTKGRVFETVAVSDNGFTRDGYTFTGWNTKADGTGEGYAEGGSYKLTLEDDILYAQWKENKKDEPKDDPKDDPKDEPKDKSKDEPEEKSEEQITQNDTVVQVVNVSNEVSVTDNVRGDSPKTGEESSMVPIIGLVLSLVGIAVLHFIGKKKKKEL